MNEGPYLPAGDAQIAAVLDYWLGPDQSDPGSVKACSQRWFSGGEATDREIRDRFAALTARARGGDFAAWSETPRGRLALIIILDQFSRNLHRGTADAFTADAQALALTLDGLDAALDAELSPLERVFFDMPLQHAESLAVQERSVTTFAALAAGDAPEHIRRILASCADYARQHRDIIARFGRFPHRNAVLGRTSTAAEREYLEEGGPTFGQ